MTTITYVEPSGNRVTVDVNEGWSLMQAAIANGVEGITGECGGSCACATCHCYVDPLRLSKLPPASEAELAMPLSCGIPVNLVGHVELLPEQEL
mgnify:CR=1 FL=1